MKGARYAVPNKLVKRLAAHHFVDYVQCIGYPYQYKTIEHASLTSSVESVEGNVVKVRLEGASKTSQKGSRKNRAEDADDNFTQSRGVEVKILGRATFDIKAEKFTQFDLVAIGHRWGGLRWEDNARAPIGFEFRLAGDWPEDRTPPYGLPWQGFGLVDPYW